MLSSEPYIYSIYNMFIIIYVLLVVIAIYSVLFFSFNIFIFICDNTCNLIDLLNSVLFFSFLSVYV